MKKEKAGSKDYLTPMRPLGQDSNASAEIFGKGVGAAKQPDPSPAMNSGILGQKCVGDGELK